VGYLSPPVSRSEIFLACADLEVSYDAPVVKAFRILTLCVVAAGCSKASPSGSADAPFGDDTPDAAGHVDGPPGHFDAVPDATGGIDASTIPDASSPDAMHTPVNATLTQTTDSTTMTAGSIACTYSFSVTAENSYYRAFTLAEHGVVGPFTISQVSFGVESADGDLLTTQPATLRILRYTGTVGTTLNLAQTTQLASLPININNAAAPIVLAFPIAATIPANGTFLVELAIPDGDPDGDTFGPVFFIGSNSSGETKSSYLRAPSCGATSPTTIASLGFANRHVIMTVTGTYTP